MLSYGFLIRRTALLNWFTFPLHTSNSPTNKHTHTEENKTAAKAVQSLSLPRTLLRVALNYAAYQTPGLVRVRVHFHHGDTVVTCEFP
jgi:hypothetical protein